MDKRAEIFGIYRGDINHTDIIGQGMLSPGFARPAINDHLIASFSQPQGNIMHNDLRPAIPAEKPPCTDKSDLHIHDELNKYLTSFLNALLLAANLRVNPGAKIWPQINLKDRYCLR